MNLLCSTTLPRGLSVPLTLRFTLTTSTYPEKFDPMLFCWCISVATAMALFGH